MSTSEKQGVLRWEVGTKANLGWCQWCQRCFQVQSTQELDVHSTSAHSSCSTLSAATGCSQDQQHRAPEPALHEQGMASTSSPGAFQGAAATSTVILWSICFRCPHCDFLEVRYSLK